MKYVPRKNIAGVLVDVKDPKREIREPRSEPKRITANRNALNPKFNIDDIHRLALKRQYWKKFIRFCLYGGGLAASAVIIASAGIFTNGNSIKVQAQRIMVNFEKAVSAFKEADAVLAANALSVNQAELKTLQNKLKRLPVVDHLIDLNDSALAISNEIAFLKNNALNLLWNDPENRLLQSLKQLEAGSAAAVKAGEDTRNALASIRELHPRLEEISNFATDEYLAFRPELESAREALTSLIRLLERNETNFLVLFQNPSEIRPAGGFLGSFAAVSLNRSVIRDISVIDIYEADNQLARRIVPPLPLQAITTTWGARDANWFFDFPTSAAKTINLLESSDMFKNKDIVFDGAVSINFRVIEDLLAIIGPVPLPEYGVTITAQNFLAEVQEEVEAGPDKITGDPKKILKVLAPKVIDAVRSADKEKIRQIIGVMENRLTKKDIMVFVKDENIERLISRLGFAGETYSLPDDFWGTYLAVVNANIAGGKSDAYIKESINAELTLDITGRIREAVGITRSHNGNLAPDFWLWKSVNQNFIKIFTAPGSKLLSLQNNSKKSVTPPINYAKAGYEIDPDIEAMESTLELLRIPDREEEDGDAWQMSELGKTVFAGWFSVKSGETKTLELETERYSDFSAEKTFQFVFDKQSGVQTSLELKIEAPAGYKWRESDSPYFRYSNPDPDKRIILTLHLKQI